MIDDIAKMNKEVAHAVFGFLDDHGYSIKFDNTEGCWRIVLQGVRPENDEYYPARFATVDSATYRALQIANGETK